MADSYQDNSHYPVTPSRTSDISPSRITGLGNSPDPESPDLGLKPIERFTVAAVNLANDLGSSFFLGLEATIAHFRGDAADSSTNYPSWQSPPVVWQTPPVSVSLQPCSPRKLLTAIVKEACDSRSVQLRPSELFVDSLAKKLRAFEMGDIMDVFEEEIGQTVSTRGLQRAILVLDGLQHRGMINIHFVDGFRHVFIKDINLSADPRIHQILLRWGIPTHTDSPNLLL